VAVCEGEEARLEEKETDLARRWWMESVLAGGTEPSDTSRATTGQQNPGSLELLKDFLEETKWIEMAFFTESAWTGRCS
jgi:hypothetical protein